MMVSEPSRSTALPWCVALVAVIVAVTLGYMLYQAKHGDVDDHDRVAKLEEELKRSKRDSQKPEANSIPEQQSALLDTMKPLLKSENEDLRVKAVEMTSLVEPKGAELQLDQVLRTDPSVKVRLATLDAIGRAKMVFGRTEVLKLLGNNDPMLRRKAAWCLGAIGRVENEESNKKVRDGLQAALRSEDKAWGDEAKAQTEREKNEGNTQPVAVLAFGALGPYIQALGEVGDKETAVWLQPYLEHTDPLVRRETVLALGKLGGEDLATALIARFQTERDDLVAQSITAVLTGPAYKMKFDAATKKFSRE